MTCSAADSCSIALPTSRDVGALRKMAHAGTPSVGRTLRAGVLGVQLEQGLTEHRGAVGALARWSSSGVPSSLITSPRPGRVSPDQGWSTRAASVSSGADRRRCDATEPDPRRGVRRRRRRRARSATATLEMSSKRRLAILWNAVSPASGTRDPDLLDQLAGGADALPVAGVVVGQRHHPLAGRRDQHQLCVQGEQRRWRVADRRAGAEVSARAWRRCGSAATRTAGASPPAAGSRLRPAARSRSASVRRRA